MNCRNVDSRPNEPQGPFSVKTGGIRKKEILMRQKMGNDQKR